MDEYKELGTSNRISSKYLQIRDNKIIRILRSDEVNQLNSNDKVISSRIVTTPLIKLGVLLKFKDKFPRFQDMNTSDFISLNQSEFTISISHKWLSSEHPDPDCLQLVELQKYLSKRNFDKENVGIFIDYTCLPQLPRSKYDEIQFQEKLNEIELVYLFSDEVLVSSNGFNEYKKSIWCLFESFIMLFANNGKQLSANNENPLNNITLDEEYINKIVGTGTCLNPLDKEIILNKWIKVYKKFDYDLSQPSEIIRKQRKIEEEITHTITIHIPKWATNGTQWTDKTSEYSLEDSDVHIVEEVVNRLKPTHKMEFFQVCFCCLPCKDKMMSLELVKDELSNLNFVVRDESDILEFRLIVGRKVLTLRSLKLNIDKCDTDVINLINNLYGSIKNFSNRMRSGVIDCDLMDRLMQLNAITLY
jgi:hypothetical protein